MSGGSPGARPNSEELAADSSPRRRAYDIARAGCAVLAVDFEDFCAHLDALGYECTLPSQLASFYLCTACSLGREDACRVVERDHLSRLRTFLARFDPREYVVDELLQQVRYRLFVGPSASIRSYRGDGSLDAWLRKIAGSVAIDFLRSQATRQRHLARLGRELTWSPATQSQTPAPADEYLHGQRSGRRFEVALRHALNTLSNEQRQVLHHYYVSELTVDQLGALYRCDRSTAARRVVNGVRAIRRRLLQEFPREPINTVEWERWELAVWCRLATDGLLPDDP